MRASECHDTLMRLAARTEVFLAGCSPKSRRPVHATFFRHGQHHLAQFGVVRRAAGMDRLGGSWSLISVARVRSCPMNGFEQCVR